MQVEQQLDAYVDWICAAGNAHLVTLCYLELFSVSYASLKNPLCDYTQQHFSGVVAATRLKPAIKSSHAALVCRLMASTLVIHVGLMDYEGIDLIHRTRWDGRLSWPGWFTHSGHFTNEVVICQP